MKTKTAGALVATMSCALALAGCQSDEQQSAYDVALDDPDSYFDPVTDELSVNLNGNYLYAPVDADGKGDKEILLKEDGDVGRVVVLFRDGDEVKASGMVLNEGQTSENMKVAVGAIDGGGVRQYAQVDKTISFQDFVLNDGEMTWKTGPQQEEGEIPEDLDLQWFPVDDRSGLEEAGN